MPEPDFSKVPCKRCGKTDIVCEQAPDSFYRRVRCNTCGWWAWLNGVGPTKDAK